MTRPRSFIAIAIVAACSANVPCLRAADHPAAAPYLAGDVIGVGFLDLTKIDLPAVLDEMVALGAVPDGDEAPARVKAAAVQAALNEMTKRGARRVYLPLRIADIQYGGPSCVIEMAEGGDAQGVVDLISSMVGAKPGAGSADPPTPPRVFRIADGAILGAATAEQLDSPRR